MNKIQSISDIITNSSSEVFIIDTKQHTRISDFIKDICDVCGWNMDSIMEFESVTTDGHIDGWDAKYKKGNLLIWSSGENSIPYPLMELIESLAWTHFPTLSDVQINHVNRIHLG